MILRQFDRHRVIQHAPIMIANRHIVTLIIRHAIHVARAHQLHQAQRIGALDADLSLNGHIPNLNMLFQVAIIGLIAFKIARQQHVVINRICLGSSRLNTGCKRGAAHAA